MPERRCTHSLFLYMGYSPRCNKPYRFPWTEPQRELKYILLLHLLILVKSGPFHFPRCYGGECFIDNICHSSFSLSPSSLTHLIRHWIFLFEDLYTWVCPLFFICIVLALALTITHPDNFIPLSASVCFHSYLLFTNYISEDVFNYKCRNLTQAMLTKQTNKSRSYWIQSLKKRTAFKHS